MKSNSDVKPSIIEPLGNGAYYYNYNVEKITVTDEAGERTAYAFDTVKIWNTPTYEAVVKAVIRAEIDESAEFDLVNSYNAAQENLLSKEAAAVAVADYKAYLLRVQEIKATVKADLATAGYM